MADVNFSVSPRILAHLGEDLIKNESIAIYEMIKNSYDACATTCTVHFVFSDLLTDEELSFPKLEKILIIDDGTGMNKSIIENNWLVVGTDVKKNNVNPSPCGRLPLGEKGIGRLSVHKLGNDIQLISKTATDPEVILKIDWDKLNQVKEIEDFKIDLTESKESKTIISETGTQIVISKVKAKWDEKQLKDVYRNITSLNSPFAGFADSFNVSVTSNIPVFDALPDMEKIKKGALYFGRCKMDGKEIVEFEYDFKPWNSLDRVKSGRKVALSDLTGSEKIIQRPPLPGKKKKDGDNKLDVVDLAENEIGPIEFEVMIFDTDVELLKRIEAEKKTVKEYLKENGGIRVYRDGVRVYNYGERDNDWLGIDLKRVKRLGGNISNNIVIGAVQLDRANSPGLKEKTNREGFVENEAYQDLEDSVNYALHLFVKERNVDKELLAVLYKKYKDIEPVLSDLNDVITLVENDVEEKETKKEILTYLYRINDQYKEVKEVLIRSANAGLNLSIVIHEFEKLISQLAGSIERRETDKAISISNNLERIVRGYSAMIKKSDIRLTSLSEICTDAIETLEFRFKSHAIKVLDYASDSRLKAYLAKSESISAIVNLLDNAIYWLTYNNSEEKYLSIMITDQIVGYYSVIVSDNGPGFTIPKEIAIKPFMTGKPHNIGSGLGLHIVNEMMHAMKGMLLFLDADDDLALPEGVIKNNVNKTMLALCFPIEKK